ncbi:MAG: hypothetical protein ACERKR_06735, partial [Deltaproteobacteria bacterium]
PTPEDARKGGHIRGRSKLFMKYSGYTFSLIRTRFHLSQRTQRARRAGEAGKRSMSHSSQMKFYPTMSSN